MIVDALVKLKRQSIIISILFLCLGITMLVCPENCVSALIMVAGYIMIIYSLEKVLEFLGSSGTLMQSISFIVAILVGMIGLAVLVFHENVLNVLSWIFGLLLILEGGNGIYYGFTFAKRSGRRGWSVIVIFASILVIAGIVLILGEIYFSFKAFKTTMYLMKMIGVALMIASAVSALRIIWTKPSKDGGEEDEQE